MIALAVPIAEVQLYLQTVVTIITLIMNMMMSLCKGLNFNAKIEGKFIKAKPRIAMPPFDLIAEIDRKVGKQSN